MTRAANAARKGETMPDTEKKPESSTTRPHGVPTLFNAGCSVAFVGALFVLFLLCTLYLLGSGNVLGAASGVFWLLIHACFLHEAIIEDQIARHWHERGSRRD
jgi:hypothetical protein